MSRARGPATFTETVDTGTAQLVADSDNPGGWTLLLDGTPQSYVDLSDPTFLHFEYVRRLAAVVDTAAPAGDRLRVLHLGGGGLTLPRYVAVTRPGSPQRVIERDAALIDFVRRQLPLPRSANLRVRAADGRLAVQTASDHSYDLIVSDVFGGAQVPGQFATVEFAAHVARVLRPAGRYVVNLADGRPLAYTRRQVATLRQVFSEVCLMGEPSVMRGRRFGNIVLAAAKARGVLPIAELASTVARDSCPARTVSGDDLTRFASGARPVYDAQAEPSPAPPANLFGNPLP